MFTLLLKYVCQAVQTPSDGQAWWRHRGNLQRFPEEIQARKFELTPLHTLSVSTHVPMYCRAYSANVLFSPITLQKIPQSTYLWNFNRRLWPVWCKHIVTVVKAFTYCSLSGPWRCSVNSARCMLTFAAVKYIRVPEARCNAALKCCGKISSQVSGKHALSPVQIQL